MEEIMSISMTYGVVAAACWRNGENEAIEAEMIFISAENVTMKLTSKKACSAIRRQS
jgi:hypothetical protein